MRVVIDTNILVSACWKPEGLEAHVINLAISGKITVCLSSEILAEYRDVLSRPKLAGVNHRAVKLLTDFCHRALTVETASNIDASPDEDDNRFLECAEAAGAEFLITGNLRHFPESWEKTRIVNARTFLSLQYKK